MKSFHSGVSFSILFFPSLILVAWPQRFCGMKRRKEERLSHSLCDARKAKRDICVALRDNRHFSSLHLVIVLLVAIHYTCLVCLMQRLGVFSQPCRYVPCSHIEAVLAPCLVNTSVWSRRWVKWCNCSLMIFPNVCFDTGRNPLPSHQKIIRTIKVMDLHQHYLQPAVLLR